MTYLYRCESEGEDFEVQQSIHATRLTSCPACGGKLVRVLSVPVVTWSLGGGVNTTRDRFRDTTMKGEVEKLRSEAAAKGNDIEPVGKRWV